MIAILHDAIDCVEKYRGATDTQGQRLFQEAMRWLLADEAEWPYSFESICGILDLDANVVRLRLRVTPDQYSSSPATLDGAAKPSQLLPNQLGGAAV